MPFLLEVWKLEIMLLTDGQCVNFLHIGIYTFFKKKFM